MCELSPTHRRDYRRGVANMVLGTITPGYLLYEGNHSLRLCWDINKDHSKLHDVPASLRAEGDWPRYGYSQRITGGTGYSAIGQLIRYVRDLPRLPMATWEYWASESIKLANERTLQILRSSDYADPKKTCCVLCGSLEFKQGIDWYSLDGKIGPCCKYLRCREDKA